MDAAELKRFFANNLNFHISRSQKSQKEIADAIGVSPQTFNTWCQAISIPRIDKIQRLADYFNVDKGALLDKPNPASRASESGSFGDPLTKNTKMNCLEKTEKRKCDHMIKHLIIDLDGTMTDGTIYYDGQGKELKQFNSKDFLGIRIAIAAGLNIIVFSGLETPETTRRFTELGITDICRNPENKMAWLQTWSEENRLSADDVGYIGDDIDDLNPMMYCGYAACPADAASDIKKIVDYASELKGGEGAVRDIVEHYLKSEEVWYDALKVMGL